MPNVSGKTVKLFPSNKSGAPLVVLNAVSEDSGAIFRSVKVETEADFTLAVISVADWEDAMTPWPAPPVWPNESPFTGMADDYLSLLTDSILPGIEASLPSPPACIALAGYSLGGLFALYAMLRTDLFTRIASASGSVWYPGFVEYTRTHAPRRLPDCLYLSIGDREHLAKNALMKTVGDRTLELVDCYRGKGIPTVFERNPGGHFRNVNRRIARAIAQILPAK